MRFKKSDFFLVYKLNYLFLCLFLLISIQSNAHKLSGRITDEGNQPLPYVIVYVSGTSIGTTANSEGLYLLDLQNGNYDISFRMIGYSLLTEKVIINNEPVKLDVKLISESVKLREVTIRADAEDPAYAIIREAQKKRKFYRDQVKLYGANAYVKSTQQLTEYPKRIFGEEVDIGEFIDTVTKIFYLSESVSELYYKEPDKYKEKMISSKVSGSPRTYSFNQATDVLLSFYDNLVNISGLTPRGIVSPIAGNSIFYYKFRLEGTFMENGVLVNKISVIPKRNSDPVFYGTIYITEDSWRIYSADLLITKAQQMEFVDTFRIKQNFINVTGDVWMPFSHQYNFSFSAFGFKGRGVVLGIFSDYNLSPRIPKNFFNNEVMKVDESANKKDTSYWETVRPVPLTDIEVTDYQRRDSSLQIRESKPYLDSLDKKNNKFSFGDIFSGYSWANSYENISLSVASPIQKINFNTVEGWNTAIEVSYNKDFGKDDQREYSLTPFARYGFKNKHLNGHVAFEYKYNTHNLSSIFLDGGTDLVQINNKIPISEFVNGLYSLMAEKNYMKVYEKQYFSAAHQSELINGIRLKIGGEYARRNSVSNTSDYSFVRVDDREYTSNDPYNPTTDSLQFSPHNAFSIEATLSVRPGQKYIDRPEGKYILGSKMPLFRINYKKGLNFAGSDIDYDMIVGAINDDIELGLLGSLKYMLVAGDFISSKKMYTPDLRHFSGNKTWFSDFRINDFKNLDYYTYSTNDLFFEAHAEENFGGFILNKIPFIRKLKFQEIAGVHYLHTKELENYLELSIGIEKLNLIRAELFTSFTNGKKGTVGFLIGLKTTFGR